MGHDNWCAAVKVIHKMTGTITRKQRQLADFAKIKLPENLPQLIASARLQTALASELNLPAPSPCTENQLKLISSLETDENRAFPEPENYLEADAWITFLYLKKRQRNLEQLKVESGDLLEVNGSKDPKVAAVSSIGSDGRIYFKGGAGACAWPDMVTIRYKKSDNSAAALQFRNLVANQTALRLRISDWSDRKHVELKKFEVTSALTLYDVEQLERIIESAENEKSIQEFIENCPQILTSLLRGGYRFCLPRPSLGKYIPDFIVSDVDSLGIRWVLIELETPISNVTLERENSLDQYARKGVSQIKEWREWLLNNLAFARQTKSNQGLGFVDIRPQSEGLVIVGRRFRLYENTHIVRNPFKENDSIEVHTYDWLLDQLRGILKFDGPPGANPYTLKPQRE